MRSNRRGRKWWRWEALFFFGALWGGLLGQPVQGNIPSYLRFLEEGLEWMVVGEGQAAWSLFEAASLADPQDPLGYLGLGSEALRRGDTRAAASFFRRAASLEKSAPEAIYGLGLCYLFNGHAEPARKLLRKALEEAPHLSSAQVYLALLALLDGRYSQAEEYFQQAQSQNVDPEWLDFLQIVLGYLRGAWPEVTRALQEQLEAAEAAGSNLSPAGRAAGGPLLPLRMSFTATSELQLELIRSALPVEDPPPSPAPTPAAPPLPQDRPYFQGLTPGQVVRGVQNLRLHLPVGIQADFVAFSVDGRCVSVTNNRPYLFRWDTSREAEGLHQLAIRTEGPVVLESSINVIVQNQELEPQVRYDPAVRQGLAERFGQLLRIAPPHYEVELLLLHAYLRSAQYAEALRLTEVMLARNWQPQLIPQLVELYARTGRSRPIEAVLQVRMGAAGGQRVALTFDDGPNIPHTQELLKFLEAFQARATFLVVGRRAEQYPYLLRQIAAQGHEIGNHSYWHRRMLNLSEGEILVEILRTEWVVRQAGLVPARLFRPPGGHSTPQVRAALARLGYDLLLWTVNGGAFKSFPPPEAARRMVDRAKDGTIFLLHNGPDNTLDLLPYLLRELRARGFRCVTVSEILRPPR